MTSIPFVDLKAQYDSIKEEVDQVIAKVIGKSAFIGGRYLAEFEENFARYCGRKHCIGVGNGTDAIQIVLKGLGVGPGDEVITAANSFIASSEAITATGARVVFVDCDPGTTNLDPEKLASAITSKTRAILPVHLYGQPADMDRILEIAGDIPVIEDSAQAHGSLYKGRKAGSMGRAATFSFYPGKNLGAYGDGGAIVTDDDELVEFCRKFSNHGRSEKYNHIIEGVNSRLDGLQAAILDVKLRHLDDWNRERNRVATEYRKMLGDTPNLEFTEILEDVYAVYHLFVIRVDRRDQLREELHKHGISSGIHYPIGLPFLKAYDYLGHKPADFPVTHGFQSRILSLPIFPELTRDKILQISEVIDRFMRVNE